MRISDWSSDVCSSDLACPLRRRCPQGPHLAIQLRCDLHLGRRREVNVAVSCTTDQDAGVAVIAALARPGRPPGRRNGKPGEQSEGATVEIRRQAVVLEKVTLTDVGGATWWHACGHANAAR